MAEPGGPFISSPRIAVIGAGGIGCALLPRLARMPFEQITIVDGDRVEERNLDRQELYALVDVGHPKAEVAAAWLRNSPIEPGIVFMDAFLDERNAEEVISMHDIVADCTDDLHVRRLIDSTCNDYGVTLVSGAVHERQGQVILLHAGGENDDLTLADLFSGRPGAGQDGCDMRNVPMHVLDEVARRMAWRIRELISADAAVNGRIEQFDGGTRAWIEIGPPVRR